MYYLATIGYETEQLDRNGEPRLLKTKYVVEAESVEEATIICSKYRSGDNRSSQLLSISKLVIDDIINEKNYPTYYKK